MKKNYNMSSASDMRRFKRDLQKQIGKASEDEIKKQLGPRLARRLKVKYDGKSKIELTGPDDLVEKATKLLT